MDGDWKKCIPPALSAKNVDGVSKCWSAIGLSGTVSGVNSQGLSLADLVEALPSMDLESPADIEKPFSPFVVRFDTTSELLLLLHFAGFWQPKVGGTRKNNIREDSSCQGSEGLCIRQRGGLCNSLRC